MLVGSVVQPQRSIIFWRLTLQGLGRAVCTGSSRTLKTLQAVGPSSTGIPPMCVTFEVLVGSLQEAVHQALPQRPSGNSLTPE